MQDDLFKEASRQAEICNACRYCESYCSVFPELHKLREFNKMDITYFANLCHNCRGCYYACQYTTPHEFNINIPQIFAQVRHKSWQDYAWPRKFATLFYKSGVLISLISIISLCFFSALLNLLPQGEGEGFYRIISHNILILIFIPASLFPFISLSISLRAFWRDIGGGKITLKQLKNTFMAISRMHDLASGHGEGCNFEDEDRFSHSRRYAHQAIMYGFLLCFASTSSATILHYFFDIKAPYGLFSIPKLFGIPGGILLVFGCIWMLLLKFKSDQKLGDTKAWGSEYAFVILLGIVGLSGLLLYLLGNTIFMPSMLSIHLSSVLTFFILTPYSKMVHAFYRVLSILKEKEID